MIPALVLLPPASAALRICARRAVGFRLALVLALAAAPRGIAAHAGSPADGEAIGRPGLETGWQPPPLPEVAGIVVVPGLPETLPEGQALSEGEVGLAVPKQPSGTELKLQWRSERYTPGPQGLEIDGNASGVEIGVKYKMKSAILIGALAQFDPAGEALFGSQGSLSDHSWMAGPTTTIRFAPGLTLEARAAWGIAESGADDLAATGPGAQRRLLSARLANPHAYGAWRFTPSINVSQLSQELLPATGAAPAELPHMTGTARVDVAPELAYRFDFARSAFIEPRAVLGGFWTFEDLSKTAPGLVMHAEPRLKAEAGVTFGVIDGPKLQALGAVEGGDAATPDVWTGRLQFSVPLR
jgi:hypothetical protein